jgi:tetratricopeptide (TPR) repeat protein
MRTRSWLAQAALAVSLVGPLSPHVAVGAPPAASTASDADDAAKVKFAAAVKLHKAGKFEEALGLFRELVQTTASPNARLYVALCLEQLGKNVEAYKEMLHTMKDAGARSDGKYEQTRDAAESELAVLNVRVAKLVVTVVDSPPGLAVTVDGVPVDASDIGGSLLLEPGAHKIEASADHQATQVRDVHLDVGETRAVALAFDKPTSEPAGTKMAGPATPTMKWAGYGAAAVSGGGLVVFAVAGLMARGKYNSLREHCGEMRCVDPNYQDDIDSGKSLQTVANVGLVVAVAGGVAAGALIYWGSRDGGTPSRVTAAPLPGGAYATFGTSF